VSARQRIARGKEEEIAKHALQAHGKGEGEHGRLVREPVGEHEKSGLAPAKTARGSRNDVAGEPSVNGPTAMPASR
jgi:hypothetical protein